MPLATGFGSTASQYRGHQQIVLFDPMKVSSNLVGASATLAVKVAAAGCNFLLFAYISRVLGTAAFGYFGVIFSAAMIAATIGSAGQQVQVMRETSRGTSKADVYAFAILVTLACSFLSAAALHLLLQDLYQLSSSMTMAGGALAVAFAFSQTLLGILRVEGRVVLAVAMRDLLWRVMTLGLLFAAITFLPDGALDVSVCILVMAVCLTVVLCFQAVSIRHITLAWRPDTPAKSVSIWLRSSTGFALAAVLSIAEPYVLAMAAGLLLPADDVGSFFAATRIVDIVGIFMMSVALYVGPKLAKALSDGGPKEVQGLCNLMTALQAVPTVVTCVVLIVFAPLVLGLFNPSLSDDRLLLAVLALAIMTNALCGANGLVLQLMGLHWRLIAFQSLALILSLVALVPLTKYFGAVGAAIGFLLSKAVWNALAVLTIRAKAGVDTSMLGVFGFGSLSFSESMQSLKNEMRKK